MNTRTRYKSICHSYYFLVGMVGMGILPGLMKSFEDVYSFSHAQMGILLSVSWIFGTTASIIGGFLFNRYGSRILVWTMALSTFSAFAIFGASTAMMFVGALLFFQFSHELGAAVNPLIAYLYDKERSKGMNLLHAFKGIGNILAPVFVMICIWMSGQWNIAFIISGILFGIWFFFFRGMKDPISSCNSSAPKLLSLHRVIRCLSDSRMVLGLTGFIFVTGCEMTIRIWIAIFLESEAHFSKATALFSLTAIMAGYTLIRMFFGFTKERDVSIKFVLVTALLNLISFFLLINMHNILLLLLFSFLLGISFGVYWPSLAAALYNYTPSDMHGIATSLFILISGLGTALFSNVVGWLGDTFSLKLALVVAPICAIIYTIIYSIFRVLTRDRSLSIGN